MTDGKGMTSPIAAELPASPQWLYPGGKILSETPAVVAFDNFLDTGTCERLIDLGRACLQPAAVSLDDVAAVVPGRNGENGWLGYRENALVRAVGERVAELVGLPLAHAEAFQILRYGPDQEYRAHYDAYDLDTVRGRRCCHRGGQRIVTALLYLSAVEEGGGTGFPRLGIEVAPAPGRLVVFNNIGADPDRPHPDSLHAGLPVVRGVKWAGNFWFHQYPMDRVVFPAPVLPDASGLPAADQPESLPSEASRRPPLTLKTNRARRILELAFAQAKHSLAGLAESTLFSYWDTYGGQPLELSNDVSRIFQLVDRRITNPLGNKRTLARQLAGLGLAKWAPTTCESVADVLKQPEWEQSVWFVKSVFGSGGKGMFCVRGDDLKALELQPDQIIQRGIEDLCLIGGRKFTVRIYVLVWNGAVYLYEDGFAVIHGALYEPGSTDYAVQIDHRGYERDDGAVTLLPAHRYEGWEAAFAQVRDCIAALTPLLQSVIEAAGDTVYAVLGLDFLLQVETGIKLVEINTMPNFIHNQEVNDTVNLPFWRCVMAMLLSGSDVDTRRLHRL